MGPKAPKGLRATFVTPWYGKGIPGGAEAEARRTAQNLAQAGVDVSVLTTCLAGLGSDWDHDTLPPGESVEDGVRVRRFPTAPRDADAFNKLNQRVMAAHFLTRHEERKFFENMINSPELFSYMAAHPEEGPFFFIPYLFTTSVWGPLIHPSKSVIIPCLHDEGYARTASVRRAFESARAVVFHVPAEKNLAAGLYDLNLTEPLVLGEGIEMDWRADGARFKGKYGIDRFVLYAGRKDAGKNVPLLIHYFMRYCQETGDDNLKLVMIGNLDAPIPPGGEKYCLDLGFVPIQDKYDAYAAADVLVQPSIMESFSIVIMEAWLADTPVMVHGDCAVTRDHVEFSGGGLHFRDYPHFAECLGLLLGDDALRAEMAAAGKRYVINNFSWPEVTERYIGLLERLCAEPVPEPVKWRGPLERKVIVNQGGPKVHQMLPDFSFGDAIGSDVLAIRKALRSWGAQSDIFAINVHQRVAGYSRPIDEYIAEAKSDDVLIFHFSIGHELADELLNFPGRKVLRYHNITPAHFLDKLNPESAARCRLGRRQLERIAPAMELGLGVSPYNCVELDEAGCPMTEVSPILLDLDVLNTPPDSLIMDRFEDKRRNVLHVGRIVPNKCIEDLIKVQYWLAKLLPGTRLLIVGADGGAKPYSWALRRMTSELQVPDVHFSGHVSFQALMGYYRVSDLYLCQSEHEGFCVPLVESMHFGLPIVAHSAAGVPGTLAHGGVLLEHKDPLRTAETVAEVLTDAKLEADLRNAAQDRLERFRPHRVAEELRQILVQRLGVKLEAAQ